MVIKPSASAPFNAFLLAEIIHDARLPPDLVSGTGAEVGESLAARMTIA